MGFNLIVHGFVNGKLCVCFFVLCLGVEAVGAPTAFDVQEQIEVCAEAEAGWQAGFSFVSAHSEKLFAQKTNCTMEDVNLNVEAGVFVEASKAVN